jgi:putative acetyltransferase
MLIRSEQVHDLAAIRALVYAAFENHPHQPPGSSPIEHKIVEAHRDAGALSLSLVAEEEGRIVGYIAFSPVLVGGNACGWYGLGPVAVLPSRQRQGIGSALIEKGMEELRARNAAGIVLLGEPEYYGRFGFKTHPRLTLEGVPPKYFMALPLAAPVPAGGVTYHSAFSVS